MQLLLNCGIKVCLSILRSCYDVINPILEKNAPQLEKQRNRDEANEATLKLDEDWTSLQPLLIDKIKSIKGNIDTSCIMKRCVCS